MMARALIFLIQLYRNTVSPLRLPTCRFTPTCSQYAVEALSRVRADPWRVAGDGAAGEVRSVASGRMGPNTRAPRTLSGRAPLSTMSGAPQRSEGRAVPLFDWFSLDFIYYPVSGIMWVWYKLFGLLARAVELLRVGLVGDVPRVHPARDPVQAVRASDPYDPADAGAAAADQGAAEEVRQGPPADGARDAEAAARTRVQPDPGLPSDAGADPGVPRAVPRAAVVQPDPGWLRSAEAVAGAEPLAGQLRVQPDRRRALPGRQPVRCAIGRQHDSEDGTRRVHGIQPGIGGCGRAFR